MAGPTLSDLAGTLSRFLDNSNAIPCVAHGSLRFPVRILDARRVWNRWDVYVTPVGGFNGDWISLESLIAYDRNLCRPIDLKRWLAQLPED